MLEQKIIDFINETIENYDKDLEVLSKTYDSSIDKYAEELKLIKENINEIVNIDLKIFEEILEESSLDNIIKEKIISSIKSIKFILESNSKNNTTYKISNIQKENLKIFFEKVEQIKGKNNIATENAKKEIEKIKVAKTRLTKILGVLEDQNSPELIEDIDIIAEELKKSSLDKDKKKDILYTLLAYNVDKHNRSLMNTQTMSLNIKRININDARTLFKKHGYDFDKLDQQDQDNVLKYGDLQNMDEVFNCLTKNNFPSFNIPIDSAKMSIMLINCDKDTITNIVNFSKIRGLEASDLMKVVPALIKQHITKSKKKKTSKGPGPQGGNNDSPIISGKSIDYMENINYLEKLGFNIKEIFDKCPHILTTSHKRLANNYKKFLAYNLSFKRNSSGTLTCPSLSFLGFKNFDEIIDRFIETSPLGYEYIRDNLSRLGLPETNDLIFYKIYASYMKNDSYGNPIIPEGPFVFYNSSKLLLRGEITQDKNQYRGINQNNKQEKTMTIEPIVRNKIIFDKVVNEKEANVDYLNFSDPKLTELEDYIDPNNPLIYNFDGTRISVLKVRRILYLLNQENVDGLDDSLLYAITYKTIIDQTSFEKINNIVKSRRK